MSHYQPQPHPYGQQPGQPQPHLYGQQPDQPQPHPYGQQPGQPPPHPYGQPAPQPHPYGQPAPYAPYAPPGPTQPGPPPGPSGPLPAEPAPDAIVVRLGRAGLRKAMPGIVIVLVFAGLALTTLVMVLTGTAKGEMSGKGGAAIMLLLLFSGVFSPFLYSVWVARHTTMTVDRHGVWMGNDKEHALIPWNSLAAVGSYWGNFGRSSKVHSIELCPYAPVDPYDRLLWHMVREEEPFQPGLPRHRYRIGFSLKLRAEVFAAITTHAGHLWFGELERPQNYFGTPDVKGYKAHRRNTTH